MNSTKTQLKRKKRVQVFVLSATIFMLSFTVISCSDSSTNADDTEPEPIPEVVTELFDNQFEIPEDLKVTCMNGEEEPDFSNIQSCRVLKWLDYTIWALSFRDNRLSLAFLAIGPEGEIAARIDRDGARYLWKIELDEQAETATFIGQEEQTIQVSWEALRIE